MVSFCSADRGLMIEEESGKPVRSLLVQDKRFGGLGDCA